ncbi:MAG: hypothetical protein RBT74_09860 [Tenuifilaceae bacterium]|nr:hypothetical protein [Tenuifilaceae bacterium]
MGFSPDIHLLGKVLATPRSAQVYLSKVGCTRTGLSLASVTNRRLQHANPDRFLKPVRIFLSSTRCKPSAVILCHSEVFFCCVFILFVVFGVFYNT